MVNRRDLADSVRALHSHEERERVLAERKALADNSSTPLDRLLEGLRTVGEDQYRADPENLHRWTAYCPACASELIGARSLTIRELSGRVHLECWRGCRHEQIMGAIRMAEARWEPPAGIAMAEAELERIRDAERLAYNLAAAGG
jgi:hypothetical protein